MKLKVMFFLLVLSISLVSANIEVLNYSVNDVTRSTEEITGSINITIDSEDADTLIYSNDDDETTLKDFLDMNGVIYTCDPAD